MVLFEVVELLVDDTILCSGKQLHDALIDPLNIGVEACQKTLIKLKEEE